MIPAEAVEAAAKALSLCRSVEAVGYDACASNIKASVLDEMSTARAAAERGGE